MHDFLSSLLLYEAYVTSKRSHFKVAESFRPKMRTFYMGETSNKSI